MLLILAIHQGLFFKNKKTKNQNSAKLEGSETHLHLLRFPPSPGLKEIWRQKTLWAWDSLLFNAPSLPHLQSSQPVSPALPPSSGDGGRGHCSFPCDPALFSDTCTHSASNGLSYILFSFNFNSRSKTERNYSLSVIFKLERENIVFQEGKCMPDLAACCDTLHRRG